MSLPERARITADLLDTVVQRYGLQWDGAPVDLGGSNNLNVQLADGDGGWVARVYCPWTSPARLAAIQAARSSLVAAGLPFATTIPTLDGATAIELGRHVVEVERFVSGRRMGVGADLVHGVGALGAIHSVLGEVAVSPAARVAPFPNHVDAVAALAWTMRGTATLRRAHRPGNARHAADLAEQLASELAAVELAFQHDLPRQLVHGDFWDNNVLFRRGEIVQILDLDFMGERPRIDDLALTLYYTNSTVGPDCREDARVALLGNMVESYDHGLATALSPTERAALPYALARTVLSFVGMLSSIDDQAARQRLVDEITPDLEWSVAMVRDAVKWHTVFGG